MFFQIKFKAKKRHKPISQHDRKHHAQENKKTSKYKMLGGLFNPDKRVHQNMQKPLNFIAEKDFDERNSVSSNLGYL